jgi:hypothetical protein
LHCLWLCAAYGSESSSQLSQRFAADGFALLVVVRRVWQR